MTTRKTRAFFLPFVRPGARIVSHEFPLGDWQPDETLNIDGHMVHFWVVPEAP